MCSPSVVLASKSINGLDTPTEWAQLSAKDQGEKGIANSDLRNTTVEKMALK